MSGAAIIFYRSKNIAVSTIAKITFWLRSFAPRYNENQSVTIVFSTDASAALDGDVARAQNAKREVGPARAVVFRGCAGRICGTQLGSATHSRRGSICGEA